MTGKRIGHHLAALPSNHADQARAGETGEMIRNQNGARQAAERLGN